MGGDEAFGERMGEGIQVRSCIDLKVGGSLTGPGFVLLSILNFRGELAGRGDGNSVYECNSAGENVSMARG